MNASWTLHKVKGVVETSKSNFITEFHVNRAVCTLSLVLSMLIASSAFGQELPFVHYTVDSELNPLPSAAVNEILVDSQGFLWFVIHSSGLFRYDGHTSEVYSADDGLPANSTIAMVDLDW